MSCAGTPARPTDPQDRAALRTYRDRNRTRLGILLTLLLGLGAALVAGLGLGPFPIPPGDVIQALLPAAPWGEVDPRSAHIVRNIRLPRLATAGLAGAGLALSGVLLQTLLRNPMASPFTLGFSSGASLGAALVIITGFTAFGLAGIVIHAFLGALLVSLVILALAHWKGATPTHLILAGVALMYFFNAATTLLIYFSDVYATREVLFWTVGSLSRAGWDSTLCIALVLMMTLPVFLYRAPALNRLLLGDEVARSMGVAVERLRTGLILLVALLVATVVSFTGGIGFLGLVAPHLARMMIGTDHRFLIPATALLGALLLMLADLISLHAFPGIVLPVGVVTAFLGSPLFLYLILRLREGAPAT
ncbi:MAG: FecCD family ABC transporter permease [Ectothiorhodospira sp.]